MALELFKPFIMSRLVERKIVQNIKAAKRHVDQMHAEVWDILEEVIQEHPVLLNRAPTLHRLGIQAFEPKLVEGKAIQVHPLVCHAFNADFDGDQMAVHLPLSAEAQAEARVLMLSSNNILSPANGRPLATPTKDMVLGTYYLTYCESDLSQVAAEDLDPRPSRFASEEDVENALEAGQMKLQEPIEYRWNEDLLLTAPGRVIFNSEVERALEEAVEEYDNDEPLHDFINKTLTKRELDAFIAELVDVYGAHSIATVLDMVKTLGFKYATQAGVTISKNDIVIPPDKEEILAEYENRVAGVAGQYERGLITEEERHESIVNIWTEATDTVADAMERTFYELNPIYMMANSGARGSSKQIRQLAGMRGLMANPKGDIIEDLGEHDREAHLPMRSVLKCKSEFGVCRTCYGTFLATGEMAEIGDAVGIIAAQSIGEPGTQLTMRTFHTGGVAGADITHGLPRVVEIFEARNPKGAAQLAEIGGTIDIEETERGPKISIHPTEVGKDGELADPVEYQLPRRTRLLVTNGQVVEQGDPLNEGSQNPADKLALSGSTTTELYLVGEVQKVYKSQGVEIHDKHIELIVRQMLKKVRVESNGDTDLLPGQLVDKVVFERENAKVKKGEKATFEPLILGITKASLATESFLSAASFQETTKVLTDASIEGKIDRLLGLKENVIIGKLIPAATGLKRYRTIEIRPSEPIPKETYEREALLAALEEIGSDGGEGLDLAGLGLDFGGDAATTDGESIPHESGEAEEV